MISIVIPTLNEEGAIGDTIGAFKANFSLPHEIIISDGKSKDKTVSIARSLGAQVVEYTGEKRQTIAMGRNDGARKATGEYLVFMDADSRIDDPDQFFARAIDRFEKNPEVVAMAVSVRVFPHAETLADKIVFICFNKYLQIANNVFKIGIAAGEFQMMRRSAFEKVGGFREDLVASEDVDLFYRLSKVGRTVFDHSLTIHHSGRRAHKVGWPRLLTTWIMNTIHMMLFDKAYSKEWKEVR